MDGSFFRIRTQCIPLRFFGVQVCEEIDTRSGKITMRVSFFSSPMRFEFHDHDDDADAQMPGHLADMVQFLTGGKNVPLSRPDAEEDEPPFDPQDILQPTASIWARKNIPNN